MAFEVAERGLGFARLGWFGLVLAVGAGCVSVITGDEATVDRFAEFERTGGSCVASAVAPTDLSAATRFRWFLWQGALVELRSERGYVYYDRLLSDPEMSDTLAHAVAQLADVDPAKLESAAERLAFWLNAYNLLVLHAASRSWREDPAFRVDQNDFAFFQQQIHLVARHTLSLNQIENGILRGDRVHPSIFYLTEAEYAPLQSFHDGIWAGEPVDPRIHFVLNCASSSCPPLTPAPLQGANLDAELEAATQAFLLDERKGAGPEGMSLIFDFYAQDFEAFGGIEGFIARYRDIQEVDTGRFLPYDWSLNLELAL